LQENKQSKQKKGIFLIFLSNIQMVTCPLVPLMAKNRTTGNKGNSHGVFGSSLKIFLADEMRPYQFGRRYFWMISCLNKNSLVWFGHYLSLKDLVLIPQM